VQYARTLIQLGRHADAVGFWNRLIQTQEKLVREHPLVPKYQAALAATYNKLAILYKNTKQFDRATLTYQKALDIWERLSREHAALREYQVELGGTCCNLAINLAAQGDPQQALAWYDRARSTLEAVHEKDAHN